jgi:hypothetical protein
MKKIILLSALLFCTSAIAQYKNVKVNAENNGPNEVTIAINPSNPQNIVAASNISNYYYSTDAGSTWAGGYLKNDSYGIWGDPIVVFDLKGNCYYFHLSRPSRDEWIDRMVCQKSTDWGATWNNPGSYTGLNHPKQQDKPGVTTDLSDSKWRNSIYITWTQFDGYESKNPLDSSNILFSMSADGGMTWSDAKRINRVAGDCKDSSNTVEGAVPCAGPNGEIYVGWAGPLGITFNRSTDGGIKWLNGETVVTPLIWGWDYQIDSIYRCNGMPVTCCDISLSPYRGNIYINWSDGRNGANDIDVFLVKSSDGGNSWSEIKRVNDDPLKNGKQQFMSWMSVDPVTGAINILFYDRRNYNDANTDVYLARSTDGGETFKNIKISETPFMPKKKVFFGDYISISAYNDFVASCWMRLDNGYLSVQYCGIDFKK